MSCGAGDRFLSPAFGGGWQATNNDVLPNGFPRRPEQSVQSRDREGAVEFAQRYRSLTVAALNLPLLFMPFEREG